MSLKFVCPLPDPWMRVHQALLRAWEQDGRQGKHPPTPLILSGWAFTNDLDKAARWRETVAWAEKNGYSRLIPEFPEEEKYLVTEMSSYDIGPLGGPMYLPWSFDAKERPGAAALNQALVKLKENWESIAGPELAAITAPLGFTGAKKRRLLLQADGLKKPPWREWDRLGSGDRRRRFTAFRKAVNDAIAPLMVDHIDFLTSSEDTGCHSGQPEKHGGT